MVSRQVFSYYLFKRFLYLFLFGFFIVPSLSFASQKKFKVVLDAGHGGKDPGNMGSGYQEKEIALDVTLRIKNILKTKGIEVILTRDDDTFVELRDRANIANKAKADMFISIHCNAHSSDASGPETYVLGLHANKANFDIAKKENSVIFLEEDHEKNYKGFNPNNPEYDIGITLQQEQNLNESIYLADLVQKNITVTSKMTRKDRSVRQAGFWVLHNTTMPSILIELGFLTNRREGAYLDSRRGKKEMSQKISKAILKYFAQRQLQEDLLGKKVDPNASKPQHQVISGEFSSLSRELKPSKDPPPPDVTYRVQVASYKEDVPVDSHRFRAIKGMVKEMRAGTFHYFFCNTESLIKANKCKEGAVKLGFKSAYIVKSYDIPGLDISLRVNPQSTTNTAQGTTTHTIYSNQQNESLSKNDADDHNEAYYVVQFMATMNKPDKNAQMFKDLKQIEIVKVGGMYKYLYGKAKTYQEAQKHKLYLKSKGYKGSFIRKIDKSIE